MQENSSEPVTRPKSPARRIALFLVVFNYAQAGISFLVNFWLARKLGATEYGVLGYGLLVGQICIVAIGFSSERTLVRDLVQSSDRHAMLSASMLLRGLMALLVVGYCAVWVLVSDSLGPKAIQFCSVVVGEPCLRSHRGAGSMHTIRCTLTQRYFLLRRFSTRLVWLFSLILPSRGTMRS